MGNETIRHIPICNSQGKELGRVRVRVGDKGASSRCEKAKKRIHREAISRLTEIQIAADGSTERQYAGTLRKAEKTVFSVFDSLFGAGTAKTLFQEIRPFASVGGGFYCTALLEKIGFAISEDAQNQNMEEYQ